MRTNIVFTLTGTDRVGIVEEVTKVLLGLGGNVETSRMVRLGGEFAMLMLVSLPAERLAGLDSALEYLTVQGYQVCTSRVDRTHAEAHPGWLPYQLEVHGADHEGIIHEIAQGLSQQGISIESMETGTTQASMSGTPLFTMKASLIVPTSLAGRDWMGELIEAGHELNVDIRVSAEDSP
jgi:glycine cleavage system transcriptional repressor